MHYIFVINGRKDKGWILEEVQRQIDAIPGGLDHQIYVMRGVGDGTRFVRIYCDLHPAAKVTFVACGGTGTLNEVASGMIGSKGKKLAVFAGGATNDFIKCFPGRDFNSVQKIITGEERKIDAVKVNDSYAINLINVGFDAMVAAVANNMVEAGYTKNAYNVGILRSIFSARFNKIRIVADGERMNRRRMLLCTIANGGWCGGEFHSAPNADLSDGWLEVCLARPMLLFTFLTVMPIYKKGLHLTNGWARRVFRYRRARHLDIISRDLIDICLDGEILSGHSFKVDVLPQEINFIVPSIIAMKKRFEPIIDKCGEIIDYLMSSPDIPKDESLQFKIRLSIEEAVENVVRYAYDGGLGWIEVGTELDSEGVMLTILLRDAGVPFNPLEIPDPDVTLSVEDRKVGGLGIFLCKQMMDHIDYKYEDGCNVLTMYKRVA